MTTGQLSFVDERCTLVKMYANEISCVEEIMFVNQEFTLILTTKQTKERGESDQTSKVSFNYIAILFLSGRVIKIQ